MKNKILATTVLTGFFFVTFASASIATSTSTSTATSTKGLNNALLRANENSNVACVLFAKSLKYGDSDRNNKGKDVRELQEKLKEKGYLNATATGYYGALTREAVKKYQKDNGISPTGNIFEKTLGQLKKHFCEDRNDKDENGAPKSCKVWFDGCNNCSANEPGGPMACTMMYCLTSKFKPYCKEYFATTTPATTTPATTTNIN